MAQREKITWKSRENLHTLLDEIPDEELPAVGRFLLFIRELHSDSLFRTLTEAPYDDEPETEEERKAIAEAIEEAKAGLLISDDEVWRQLGDEP